MVGRLVWDVVWRARWMWLSATVFLFPLWLVSVMGGDELAQSRLPALSVVIAEVLGLFFVMNVAGARTLRHLPLTQREHWTATWILAALAPATLLLGTKVIAVLLVLAFGGTSKLPGGLLAISTAYDIVWAGAMLFVWVRLEASLHRLQGRWTKYLVAAAFAVAVAGSFVAPILLGDTVPVRLDEFTWPFTLALGIALAMCVGALVRVPSRGIFAGDRPRTWTSVSSRADSKRLFDRLPGLPRILVPYLAGMVALPAAIGVVMAAYGVVSGAGAWWFVPPGGDLFDAGADRDRELTLVVLVPSLLVTMWGAWTPWVRLLKVLPVTVRQTNALLLLTPFVTWAVIWVIGHAAYAVAYGSTAAWRLDLVLGLAGVAALAHAVFLRFQGSTVTFWMLAFSGGVLPRLLEAGLGDSTHVIFAAIGAIAAMAAAGLNHATLTQSTSSSVPYRRPQAPFGPPATPGPR